MDEKDKSSNFESNSVGVHLIQDPSEKSRVTEKASKSVMKYHKLKKIFTLMLILNAVLLLVVCICMFMIVPHVSDFSPRTVGQKEDQSARVKCQMIQEKLHRLYKNGQMVEKVKTDDECSMGDLLDSFMQHIEDSKLKEESNKSAAFHLISNETQTERCRDSRTLHCLKNWKISMNTSAIKVINETIFVPSTGVYFLYSRVVIDAKLNKDLQDTEMITHSIRYSTTGYNYNDLERSSVKCGVIKNTMNHISYIEKIQYLERSSMIKVALDYPRDVDMQNSINTGVFGMFKL